VPNVVTADDLGFGTQLLMKVLPQQIGAKTELNFQPDGLRASITVPLTATSH
jgi:two-component sensor histidine kinase